MVTFAAATKPTSTILPRAPAQRRVDHFVAITCSDPNDSCDSYNGECRSRAQLVSPSRDPIELGIFLSRGLLQTRLGLYRYIRCEPLARVDPLGLYDVGEGEDDVLDSVQDVLDWIEEFLGEEDDLTDPTPHGLPWDPDDIVGAGSDLLLNIALELARTNSPCSKWMKQIFEGMACGAATCDPTNCSSGPFHLGANAGNPMRYCLFTLGHL